MNLTLDGRVFTNSAKRPGFHSSQRQREGDFICEPADRIGVRCTKFDGAPSSEWGAVAAARSFVRIYFAAVACSLCIACVNQPTHGISAGDDELLLILADLAREGVHAICDGKILEDRLAIRIEDLKFFSNDKILANEVFRSIRSRDSNILLTESRYSRFRSREYSACSLEIVFVQDRLCDSDSLRVQKLLGVQVEFGAPITGADVRYFGYKFAPRTGVQAAVGLGRSNQRCASRFKLSANGDWK